MLCQPVRRETAIFSGSLQGQDSQRRFWLPSSGLPCQPLHLQNHLQPIMTLPDWGTTRAMKGCVRLLKGGAGPLLPQAGTSTQGETTCSPSPNTAAMVSHLSTEANLSFTVCGLKSPRMAESLPTEQCLGPKVSSLQVPVKHPPPHPILSSLALCVPTGSRASRLLAAPHRPLGTLCILVVPKENTVPLAGDREVTVFSWGHFSIPFDVR